MSEFISYGRQSIDDEDIDAVVDTLRSDYLTTGPKVAQFEAALSAACSDWQAVTLANGTAALHAMMDAIDLTSSDEVIVPTLTFAATANSVVYKGAKPVFCDVDPKTLLIDLVAAEKAITPRTKAIVAVDYAGQPCDYDGLKALAEKYKLRLLSDACHSFGATYKGRRVGTLAELTSLSFHPVKNITTCEGGAVLSDSAETASRLKAFRNHGITIDHRQRSENNSWYYEISRLGYNYRLSDLHCALGLAQLKRLEKWIARRNEIARNYIEAFLDWDDFDSLELKADRTSAYHLFVIKFRHKSTGGNIRDAVFRTLRARGIGTNVHYMPVHLHPFYKNSYNAHLGMCPNAEDAFDRILSLPIYPGLTPDQQQRVIRELRSALNDHRGSL